MIKRVVYIVSAAIVFSFAYNFYRLEMGLSALPWQPQPMATVDDSELFEDSSQSQAEVDEGVSHENGVRSVSTEQVKRLVEQGGVILVDARNAEEFSQGTIGEAINIFPEDDGSHIEILYSLPIAEKIVVFCSGGACDLSHRIADDLVMIGAEKVYLYEGGYEEWQASK